MTYIQYLFQIKRRNLILWHAKYEALSGTFGDSIPNHKSATPKGFTPVKQHSTNLSEKRHLTELKTLEIKIMLYYWR